MKKLYNSENLFDSSMHKFLQRTYVKIQDK